MTASIFDLPWAEHGLAGLVICTLFALVFFLIRSANKKDSSFTQSINRESECNREERAHMAAQHERNNNRLADAITALSKAISQKDE